MHPKDSPAIKLRDTLEDVGWRAREAVMAVEEGVIWRGTDTARDLAYRAAESPLARGVSRLRFIVERRVTWPLADAMRDSSEFTRTAIATAAVTLALAAGSGGAILASGGGGGETSTPTVGASRVSATGPVEASTTLEGVSPTFTAAPASSKPIPPTEPAPKNEAGHTAWEFSQAFVLYEVGKADQVAADFDRLATPPLSASLAESPPRLPSNAKVPEARVLNVVLGKPEGDRLEASVSLVRLEAVSELRLTLQHSKRGWRVSEVLG